jgi:hypothetical protein
VGSHLLRSIGGLTMSGPPSPSDHPAWRSNVDDKIASLRDIMDARLNAMDRASVVLADNVNRVPTLLDRETSRLTELFDEKFASTQTQFKERDIRTDQDKIAASTAVTAALTALKEMIALQNTSNTAAISKSEASVITTLDSLNRIISSTKEGLSADINNLKQRMDRGEGTDRGERMATADTHSNIGSISLIIGAFVGVMGIVVAILTFTSAHYSTPAPANPIPLVGIDSKRVDDLIAQSIDRNRDMTSRMDALSARLNSLAPPKAPPSNNN